MFNEYSFVPRSADIKRAWLGSLRILPSAPAPTARGRLKERRETRKGSQRKRGGKKKRKRRRWKLAGGCGDPKPTGHCFLQSFLSSLSPVSLSSLYFLFFSS